MLHSNKFVFFGRTFTFVEWKNVYKFSNLIFFVYVLENNHNKIVILFEPFLLCHCRSFSVLPRRDNSRR